jgi:hypothetical protein
MNLFLQMLISPEELEDEKSGKTRKTSGHVLVIQNPGRISNSCPALILAAQEDASYFKLPEDPDKTD